MTTLENKKINLKDLKFEVKLFETGSYAELI